jgi:hypothetical protein
MRIIPIAKNNKVLFSLKNLIIAMILAVILLCEIPLENPNPEK